MNLLEKIEKYGYMDEYNKALRMIYDVSEQQRQEILNYKQGSDEWLHARKGRINSSMAGMCAGHNLHQSYPITYALELMLYKDGYDETLKDNPNIVRGKKLEPFIHSMAVSVLAKHLHETEGVNPDTIYSEETGSCLSSEHPWLAASTDGILHYGGKQVLLEYKAPNKLVRRVDDDGVERAYIKDEYYDQITMAMYCYGIHEQYFVMYSQGVLCWMKFVFDEEYWNSVLFPSLSYFYKELYLPGKILVQHGHLL